MIDLSHEQFWGAHASRVLVSASRRNNLRSALPAKSLIALLKFAIARRNRQTLETSVLPGS